MQALYYFAADTTGIMVEKISLSVMQENTLEIEEDINHHRRFWRIKRFAWLIMFLIVVIAMLGYTGGGSSSEETIIDRNISVNFQKYSRAASIVPFRIQLENIKNDTFSIQFTNNYLKEVNVEGITPMPFYQKAGQLTHTFYFIKENKTTSVEVCYFLKASRNGCFNFDVRSEVGKVSLEQIIFP